MWDKVLVNIIDDIDIKIVNLLLNNGRLSDQSIAENVGLSKTAIRNRRLELERRGIIKIVGLLVIQNTKLVYDDIFVKFKLNITKAAIDKFIEKCVNDETVYEVTEYIDHYDLLIRLFETNQYKIKEHITDIIKSDDIIAEYLIIPAIKSEKAWGIKL